MAERSFKEEVEKLKLGAGDEFRGEGILAITKALLESGVSYVAGYQGAPISHLMDVLADANDILEEPRRPFREQRERGDRRRDARGLGELSAARRGDVQIGRRRQCRVRRALEPRVRRRHRRRAGHHRRGLRRRLLDHAGARASVRDEIADLAARPAPEPALHRQRGEEGLRAVRGHQHAGDARGAHPRLPRARPLRDERQCAADLHAARRDGEPAPPDRPHRAAARELPAREGEDREALAGRGEVHRGQQAQRVLRRRPDRHRHRDAGRHVQHHAARAGACRPRRLARPFARAALRDERDLSADRPRAHPLRAGQARDPDRRGRPAGIHRAGDQHDPAPRRHADPRSKARACCRWRANTPAAWCATA